MAIKLKGTFSEVVKDTRWFNDQDVALATHHLIVECFDSSMLVSFAQTRKGDVMVSVVQGAGASDKFYFSDKETYLTWVLEIAGGDLVPEDVVRPAKARKTPQA